VGVDADYLSRGGAYFTAESHMSFLSQANAEEQVEVSTQVLSSDEKRLHLYHRLIRADGGEAIAESEALLLHVDSRRGRATAAEPDVLRRVALVSDAHSRLPRPERAGRRIGDPKH